MNALQTTDHSSTSTCWNSDACDKEQAQFFVLEFQRPVQLHSLAIEFQAGFIGETCKVQLLTSKGDWKDLVEVEPEDNHDLQTFSLLVNNEAWTGTALKLVFDDFTDFYGRVTIYRIQVWGKEVS